MRLRAVRHQTLPATTLDSRCSPIRLVAGEMAVNPTMLALARRHVVDGRLIVSRQKFRIARLRAAGYSTLHAEQTWTFSSARSVGVDVSLRPAPAVSCR